MMSTVGLYYGPPPEDPHADIRRIFTVRENQQDGLGSILKYCQTKSGFTVGSTCTERFREILNNEFSSILAPMVKIIEDLDLALEGAEGVIALPTAQHLEPYFQAEAVLCGFLGIVQAVAVPFKSIIQFVTKVEGDSLSLDVDETFIYHSGYSSQTIARRRTWVVDRDAMARQADWLVNKLDMKESLDNWNKMITSPGF